MSGRALSRAQIDQIESPIFHPGDDLTPALDALAQGRDIAICSPLVQGRVSDQDAKTTADGLAAMTWMLVEKTQVGALIVVGGDTAAAVLGSRSIQVIGNLEVAVPIGRLDDPKLTVVTKGGGMGTPSTLKALLN